MANQILTAVILILTCAVGIWKFVARLKSEKRKIAEEARIEYEEAVKSGDTSRITAALTRMQRL